MRPPNPAPLAARGLAGEVADLSEDGTPITAMEAASAAARMWARGMRGSALLQMPQKAVDGVMARVAKGSALQKFPSVAAVENSAVNWAALTQGGHRFQVVFWALQVLVPLAFIASCFFREEGAMARSTRAAIIWSVLHIGRGLHVVYWLCTRPPAGKGAPSAPPPRSAGATTGARAPAEAAAAGQEEPPAGMSILCFTPMPTMSAGPSGASGAPLTGQGPFMPGMAVWDWLEAILFVPPCLMLIGDVHPGWLHSLLVLVPCELAVGWHALLHALLPALLQLPAVIFIAAVSAPLLVATQLMVLPACCAIEAAKVAYGGLPALREAALRARRESRSSTGMFQVDWGALRMDPDPEPIAGLGIGPGDVTAEAIRSLCCVQYGAEPGVSLDGGVGGTRTRGGSEAAAPPAVRTAAPGAAGGGGVGTCTICLEAVRRGAWAARPPCGHVFHGGCMDRWLVAVAARETSSTELACPLCKCSLLAPAEADAEAVAGGEGPGGGVAGPPAPGVVA